MSQSGKKIEIMGRGYNQLFNCFERLFLHSWVSNELIFAPEKCLTSCGSTVKNECGQKPVANMFHQWPHVIWATVSSNLINRPKRLCVHQCYCSLLTRYIGCCRPVRWELNKSNISASTWRLGSVSLCVLSHPYWVTLYILIAVLYTVRLLHVVLIVCLECNLPLFFVVYIYFECPDVFSLYHFELY